MSPAVPPEAERPRTVLVVGDANPDLILRGDVTPRFGQTEQLLADATWVIGGSAAITAHGLARLGRPVALLAALGRDADGDRLERDLAGTGVRVDTLLRRADRPTGLTIVLSRETDRAILTRPGAIPTLTAGDIRSAVSRLRADGLRHVHVAALYLQPDLVAALPDVLAEVRALGVTTSLDPNDDPAGTWAGIDALLPHLDVLLPNRAEVSALAREDVPQRAAARLAARGPIVVVKDGERGAFAASPSGESVATAAQPREASDTTGAGDSFDAAFLDAWLDASPLTECLRHGVLAGSLAVTAIGGTAAQPTRDDLITAGRNHEH